MYGAYLSWVGLVLLLMNINLAAFGDRGDEAGSHQNQAVAFSPLHFRHLPSPS